LQGRPHHQHRRRSFAKGSPLPLRVDDDAATLRELANRCRNCREIRRLLSLAAIDEDMKRTEAARIGGMDRRTLRDWVHWSDEEGPDGLAYRHRSGCPCRLGEAQLAELAEIVEIGPDRELHGVTRWRRVDLQKVIEARFDVVYSARSLPDLLARLSFTRITGRPQYPAQIPRRSRHSKNFARTLRAPKGNLPRDWWPRVSACHSFWIACSETELLPMVRGI
jgi:transposase